jgi:CBS domain-containing protein
MKVTDIMTKDPACCFAGTTLKDVAAMMATYDCGCIPVVDEARRPVGTVTDRDITLRTLPENKDSLTMFAGDVMTADPVTVFEDTGIEECFKTMEANQIRRILVVDKAGACTGILAQADVACKVGEHETAELVKVVSRAA